VKRFLIVAGATLAVVTAANAADLPRRQPVYQEAAVGKMPIGKTPTPIGKTPVGKTPVAPRPY
jgi:opacity protein-like surface antigen